MPYKFNGKEFDEETGLYYYGARYMNPKTSLWYGVDPVAEKYPSVGAYVYCVDNPIKLIDPNGKDWYHDKDGTMQYSPTVHSSKDLGSGQRYVGATFHDKKMLSITGKMEASCSKMKLLLIIVCGIKQISIIEPRKNHMDVKWVSSS